MSTDTPDDDGKAEIIHLAEARGLVYFLTNEYEEADNGDGVGYIYSLKDPRDFDDEPRGVLSSNDTIRTMWASPSGALWTGSADGFVGTQAKTSWPPVPPEVTYVAENRSRKWSVIALPETSDGIAPNVTSMWGLGDDVVFAGTFTGDIYRGDTKGWVRVFDGSTNGQSSINAFGGPAPDDVHAVGDDGTLLHFDGTRWSRLRAPGLPNGSESWLAVHTLPDGQVLILGSGTQSRLLHGRADNLTEFGRYPLELLAMAPLGNDRLLFAATEGAAELVGHDVQLINTEHEPITAFAGDGRVFFTDADQDVPAFIEYDPRQTAQPWDRPAY